MLPTTPAPTATREEEKRVSIRARKDRCGENLTNRREDREKGRV